MNRQELTKKYNPKGLGLEIAGLHNPWPVFDPFTHVIQLDLFDTEELRKQYPEMNHKPFVDVHILDDGNLLRTIPSETMDFLFSSHVFEHLLNPILGLDNWLRVVKKGRYVFMAIPLRDQTFDRERKNTPLNHLLTEFDQGPLDLANHYRDYYMHVDHLSGETLEKRVQESMVTKPHVHFHCWDFNALKELFLECKPLLNYEICEMEPAGHEAFVVLKKL